jgi:uncharacterized linocin/CFP29 family protein
MNHLFRDKAPISDAAWAEITEEATTSLHAFLAARRLVDLEGPKGWAHAAEPTGRVRTLEGPGELEVEARLRQVQPLVELRTPFTLDRAELDAIDRGACDADLDPVRFAARRAAMAEDRAVFHGFAAAGITGISEATPHDPVVIGDDYDAYPSHVAAATAKLKLAGVAGPYALAIGPRCYTGVLEQSEMGGYPVLEHLRLILAGGPIVFAPGVDGAVVLSQRGGDVELVVGQDFSIGYLSHDRGSVELYLEESFTVKLCAPEAAVYLTYED